MRKLQDPSLPPEAIVEKYKNGSAKRNDGVPLKPANRSPWYVLATIWGEQREDARQFSHDQALAIKNRNTWNKWSEGRLNGVEKDKIRRRLQERLNDTQADLPDPSDNCNFSLTFFKCFCSFSGFRFYGIADFREVVFDQNISFVGATFKEDAIFVATAFGKHVYFSSGTFKRNAIFIKAVFYERASFIEATFRRTADFSKATFGGFIFFRKATFHREAFFTSSTFQSTTGFEGTCFVSHVPKFHAADIYQDTVFPIPYKPEKNWPPVTRANAAHQKRAYSRLRLFFNKTQQVDEEQFFHRQEMRCKRALATGLVKPLFWLYEKLSNYGNSIARPVLALSLLIALSGMIMNTYLGMSGQVAQSGTFWRGLGWSFANALPFTGFSRTYMGYGFYRSLPVALKILGGFQTLIGVVLLFLLGLGLRNTFRLR